MFAQNIMETNERNSKKVKSRLDIFKRQAKQEKL